MNKRTRAQLPPGRSNRSATGRAVEALLQMLRSGEYRPNDRLPSELELVRTFRVGRSAVREAIRELATLNLVDVQHGRGTYVLSLRPDLLVGSNSFQGLLDDAVRRELLEVRRIVEPGAAALATERANESDLERLAHDVQRLAEAVNVGFRPPEDLGFHLDIVRATHNTSLSRLAGAIVSFYARDTILPSARDVEEHGAIYDALARRDAESAHDLMQAHLDFEAGMRGGDRRERNGRIP